MTISQIARILVTPNQRRQMYAIRRRAHPHEGCGLLLGTYQSAGTTAAVTRVVEMKNIAESTSTFSIDPEHQYSVLTAATNEGLDQVGIYHSHPAPPSPSGWDLEYMEYNPCVWVIDGIKGRRYRMKAYQLIEGRLFSVDILTVID